MCYSIYIDKIKKESWYNMDILTKEYYNLLKAGKSFQVKNGIILELEEDCFLNVNWEDTVTVYTRKEKGIIIKNSLYHIAILYEDFNKGYDHIMDIWQNNL